MKFAKRMDRFGEGVFSKLAEIKKRKLEAGEQVIDLSIGAPNIPPVERIRKIFKRRGRNRRIIFMPSVIRKRFWRRFLTGIRDDMV